MKFQILTNTIDKMQAIATGHTHEAICFVPPWISHTPIRMLGDSEKDAKDRVVKYIQGRLDDMGGKWSEVDVVPNIVTKDNLWGLSINPLLRYSRVSKWYRQFRTCSAR